MRDCDVVVVGGGIVGGAAAAVLAREGLDVVVLEATTEYEDRVRGESMLPWGVKEAQELGLAQVLLDAGAHVAERWVPYAEGVPHEIAAANPIPVGMMIPGVPGSLNLRHPVACQTLVDAAVSAGAELRRGVRDVKISLDGRPEVMWSVDGRPERVTTRLVVGADGRNSAVRRQAGIPLHREEPVHMISGLLVEGLDVPDDHDLFAVEADLFLALFHQGDGVARAYLCPGLPQRHRFAGGNGAAEFLRSLAFECIPFGEALASGRPAGPCITYSPEHTTVSSPCAAGVVLVGDAAGYSNPIIGQGLSSALRDVRLVRDALRGGDWSPTSFATYVDERAERDRRIRYAAAVMASGSEDCPDRAARRRRILELQQTDPVFLGLMAGMFAGPESGPEEAYDGRLLAAVRGEGQ